MKKNWKRILIIALILVTAFGILNIFSTGIPVGKAVLTYKGTQVTLTPEESYQMWKIFVFKFYRYGIGGCPYEEDVTISFGNAVYAIATDDCYTAKEWNKEKYFEFNRLEFQQIAALFEKYCGDTSID